MEVECIVVAGTWKYEENGQWDFDIDKRRMCRVVHFVERDSLQKVCGLVFKAFGEDEKLITLSLSYLTLDLESLSSGKQTPPVILSTDASLMMCCRHLLAKSIHNMYVTFLSSEGQGAHMTPCVAQRRELTNDVGGCSRDSVLCGQKARYISSEVQSRYTTPCIVQKSRVKNNVGGRIRDVCLSEATPRSITSDSRSLPTTLGSVQRRKVSSSVGGCSRELCLLNTGRTIGSEERTAYTTPCPGQKRKVTNVDGGCSRDVGLAATTPLRAGKAPIEVCVVNKKFIDEVEAIEESMSSSCKRPVSPPRWSLGLTDEGDNDSSEDSVDVEDIDVWSRGYDNDFWEPWLDDSFGGSNVVEIICETSDESEHEGGILCRNLGGQNGGLAESPASQSLGVGGSQAFGGYGNVSRSGSQSGSVVQSDLVGVTAGVAHPQTNVESESIAVDIDIPPMADDTLFNNSFIPDLDWDDGDETITVDKTFVSKVECQIALAIYAIRNMFQYKQRRTTKVYFIVSCADLECGWMVNAHKMKETDYYRIRKASLNHTCSIETRSKFSKMATSRVIAHVYQSKFNVLGSVPKPKDLQQLVLEELRVSTSYSKCWRANQTANEVVRGTEEESYLKVEEYLHMIKLANPGSKTDIKTEIDVEGVERFLYLFLAFGASIEGFKSLRPVLVLDGTHLSGKYKGVLLTASGQDANFQVFPLAFAIVDSENDASWNWFLSKLEKDIIADSPSLSIISDRHQSILKATKSVFKLAKHGGCIVHLARNVISHFKNKGLANRVMATACCHRVKHFKKMFDDIRVRSEGCAKFLEEIGFEHWSRAYLAGNRYNLMTSNIAESLNNALRNARKATIVDLLIYIQTMLMRWFGVRREKSLSHRGYTTPEVDKIISSNLASSSGSQVTSVSAWSCEVVGKFCERHFVQLGDKKCTCKAYDNLKIPCGHALIAAGNKRYDCAHLVGDHFRTFVWRKTYDGVIKPNGDPGETDIPHEINTRAIQPPRVRRPCGRPRVNRLLSSGEIAESKIKRKCGRCGGLGHNKTSCKNPI